MKVKQRHLAQDFFIILVSVGVAFFIVQSQIVDSLLALTSNSQILNSFIAGLFFTSAFTTVPAMMVLGKISQIYPVIIVAGVGALGATIGDFIIFEFIKDRVSEDFNYIMQLAKHQRWTHVFHRRLFCRLMPFLGGLVIASPLPDELALTMMGLSKVNNSIFLPVSYIFNFIGIMIIGAVARGIWG